jgi:Mannosyltransferase putative
MQRGIYITANDKVTDHAIALLNSIRRYDKETPVCLIPYDENYHNIAALLKERFNVEVYEDLELVDRLSRNLHEIFGGDYFARPNQFRKQACWFGPFDEFLYIDTDIVVFEKIADNLDWFSEYDFLSCDYQHRGGIKNVFSQGIIDQGVFTATELEDMFNGGWWASKKGILSEADLYETFTECAQHPEYFDFSQKTSDQPIINYMILKRIQKRFNVTRRPGGAPGSWGGSSHFVERNGMMFDTTCNQPLQYLHWAGIRIEPGCPYWDIWVQNRYLGETVPQFELPAIVATSRSADFQKNLKQGVKEVLTAIRGK